MVLVLHPIDQDFKWFLLGNLLDVKGVDAPFGCLVSSFIEVNEVISLVEGDEKKRFRSRSWLFCPISRLSLDSM